VGLGASEGNENQGRQASAEHEDKYTAERNYQMLMELCGHIIAAYTVATRA